ncbi:MAG: dienelactone hydrolase family protein [Pseudomonadales bacterium]
MTAISNETIQLRSADGFEFGVYQARPEGSPRGAVVVIQEIFGVNDHIRRVADGYAADGYLALAPRIFDRVEPGIELGYGESDMGRGIELAFQKLDHAQTLLDLQATVDLAAAAGRVGVVGYCFGGLLAWRAACQVNGVAAAVCYYGGGIAREAELEPRCPVMMHFGERDAHIPISDVETIRAAQPDASVFVYPADHGFNCDQRGSFDADSAALARRRTLEFFHTRLR